MEKQNPFKSIGTPPQDVPEYLKEKIMRDITTAKSLMEMPSAFASKHKEAMSSLFKTNKKFTQV